MLVLNHSCMETLIPENNDSFPKCGTLSIGMQTTKKSTREKGTQYQDATIRNKFTQTVNIITYNTISIQCHILALDWNQGKRTTLASQVLREQNKKRWLYLYLRLVFEICETLKSKKLATSKMEPFLMFNRSQLLHIISWIFRYFLFTLSGFFSRPPNCSWGEKSSTKVL